MVENEYDNMILVDEFYQRTFFNYLFSQLDIDENVKFDVLFNMDSSKYIEDLCLEIDRIGLEEYQKVLSVYNFKLRNFQANGKLPTPQQIVDSEKAKKPIDLLEIMQKEEISMKSVVSNAVDNRVALEEVCMVDNSILGKEAKDKEGETHDN